ncbi:polysaccharide pyruvyl transferase family protein [Cellulomonas carbonis]|uniref:polysaccharide pyruvyl transferase family protein n=1 Tax=Cellulomonas carbonis TaxID=1386092 RepID=UPI00126A7578|nr:polysaccharide pyruvyl transferase family protein [Cellulomonas carbonis]GGC05511.1 polysaccharide pyruvyl transferase [Cellulomonas carbonis]
MVAAAQPPTNVSTAPAAGMLSGVRRRVGELRRATGYVPFLRSHGRSAAYVGWSGNGNLGDEAMLEAHRRLLAPWDVRQVPNLPDNAVLRAVGRRGAIGAVCLGGGTLIFNGHFRETLTALLAAAPSAPRTMLSVGVEDPTYAQGRRAAVRAEPALWAPILREFPTVRVRGPRSAASLAEIGVDAQVVGDPALALALPADLADPLSGDMAAVRGERPVVGINVGVTDDLWGQDEDGLLGHVRDLARRLVERGTEVRLISTTTEDTAPLERLAAEVPGVVAPPACELDTVLRALAACDVLVGEKLHALVLAARVGVPGIAMEYRPKCRDFQQSVGRERYTLRTDELTSGSLLELVDEVLADLDAQRAAMVAEVATLATELERAADDARSTLVA